MIGALTVNDSLLAERRIGNTLVITPSQDLREFEFDQIEAAAATTMREVDNRMIKNVVIDFRNTDFYGSTALGFFVKLWKRVRSGGGKMAFCNVSAHEREILDVTRLNTLWPLCGSLEDALATVNQ
jgi:anti-anti-sigma factor